MLLAIALLPAAGVGVRRRAAGVGRRRPPPRWCWSPSLLQRQAGLLSCSWPLLLMHAL